jgi:hypothetical protein
MFLNSSLASAVAFPIFLLSLAFRDGAKIEIAQAQKKLEHRQKKANFEDAIVKNIEQIRETLLNANRIHLERV